MSVMIKETLCVKPIRPTKHVQIPLSNCDIRMPPIYNKFIYFFKNGFKKDNFMNVQKLLESFREVLTDYYPLAGTVKDAPNGKPVIDCNDQGAQFIIAESSDITINQLEVKNWEHAAIPNGLVPTLMASKIDPILLLIQHTTFADGSVALGFAYYDKIMDGLGFSTFIANWGRRARSEQIDPPIHDRSLLKASSNSPSKYFVKKPKNQDNLSGRNPVPVPVPTTAKVFHFSNDVLKRLRDYYSADISNGNWISTNDALVAHFWRTITRVRNLDLNTELITIFPINGRDILNPPIPKSYYGAVVFGVDIIMIVSQLINGPPSAVAQQVRKAVTEMNASHLQSIIDWVEQQQDKALVQAPMLYDGKFFRGTNWSNFQKNNPIDFGDGTPIKLRFTREIDVFDGLYVILHTEDGVEVYLSLQTDKLEILEQDPEFKKFIVP